MNIKKQMGNGAKKHACFKRCKYTHKEELRAGKNKTGTMAAGQNSARRALVNDDIFGQCILQAGEIEKSHL